jgi:NAD(P)-dependent dehydrogenase (short-subunit alcohol dehydrogenase family)
MLEGRVAIVTGAGRGVGKEIAKHMAAAGAKVVVNDYGVEQDGTQPSEGPAADTVSEIKEAGGEAVVNFGSVASFDDATAMVKQALDTFGGLHIMCNPAGILRDRMFHKMSPEDWQEVIDVHLTGHYNMCRAPINHFREQEYGRIITCTSVSGTIGNIGQANYGAAKLGIVALTRILAMESISKGITVNCISPSAATRMTESVPTPKDPAAAERRRIRLERSRPEDIAPLSVYLASEQAGDITGQVFGQRAAEISLFGFSRPIYTVHHHGGWTPQLVGEHAMPTLRPKFTPLEQNADVQPALPLD